MFKVRVLKVDNTSSTSSGNIRKNQSQRGGGHPLSGHIVVLLVTDLGHSLQSVFKRWIA